MAEYIYPPGSLTGDSLYLSPARKEGGTGSRPKMLMSLGRAGTMGASYETGHPNRLRFLKSRGIPEERVAGLKQIHSQLVHAASFRPEESAGRVVPAGDGLVTDRPEHILAVTVADCLPIFLYHSSGTPFGVVHSGWKGTGIAAEAVRRMGTLYDTPPAKLRAVIGPGIGPCCYGVDEERAGYFMQNWGKETAEKRDRWYLDLKKANCILLEECGVTDITVYDACTCCNTAFGSYRRERTGVNDGAGKGAADFTRMIALIGHLL